MSNPHIAMDAIRNEVPIPAEELEQAGETFKGCMRRLALSHSVIANIAISLCYVVFTKSSRWSTFAVTLAADGNPILVINTEFIIKIGHVQAVTAVTHEAYHLLLRHLYVDVAFQENPNWILAKEVTINARIQQHLKLALIEIDNEVVIVDPAKVYKQYRDALRRAGKTPLDYDKFVSSDLTCFNALEEMPKPPKPPDGMSNCVHTGMSGKGDSDGKDGKGRNPGDTGEPDDGTSPAVLDRSQVDKFMTRVLAAAVTQAKGGSKVATREVVSWMDSSPEASQIWGDLGAGALRGETTHTRKTDMWERWTADVIGSKLMEGLRLRYNVKVWWDPRVTPNGRQPRKRIAVFVDASGSMQTEILRKIAALIGEIEDIDVSWHSFDGEVWPFELGESFKGGGGTSFQVIIDHIENAEANGDECCEEEVDCVLILTDLYAGHVRPADPDKYIFLVTPGGDEDSEWVEKAGMSVRHIELP